MSEPEAPENPEEAEAPAATITTDSEGKKGKVCALTVLPVSLQRLLLHQHARLSSSLTAPQAQALGCGRH